MDVPAITGLLTTIRRALLSLGRAGEAQAIDRAVLELDALAFHLGPPPGRPIVALIGGTGTGKSTISNRLLEVGDAELTASNFRRTFTAGPVAIVGAGDDLPPGWLSLPHVPADALPAKGVAGHVVVVRPIDPPALLSSITLIDTPDVDGDQPAHHALADRVFRWASVAVFVVSPEKYQMPELLPYFRLAQRYALPTRFVMNKVEDRAVVDDFVKQLAVGGAATRVYVQPRDDATLAALRGESLDDLRTSLTKIDVPADRERGLGRRASDLAARIVDQVVEPLRVLRGKANDASAALRELRAREAGVDVDPMTRQLRKRMQQRSILYLMGPQRMLERVKAAPAALARLPRSTLAMLRGSKDPAADQPERASKVELPDFATIVVDQFGVVQATIADVLRARCPACVGDDWRLDPNLARQIVVEEIDGLRTWLEARWNSNPRDTNLVLKLAQKLPGGQRLTKLSESAPYLVVVACGLNHFAFSGLDLLVIGGFSLATWIGEKISDEVAQRTRLANKNIDARFASLVRQQTDTAIAWLDARIPPERDLDALRTYLDDLRALAG